MRKIALAVTLVMGLCSAATAGPFEKRVRAAARATYVHGMTAEIADREVGGAAVPVLLALLADPKFPRRDNVVAFLTYLADDTATEALVGFLREPPAGVHDPEEDRSLLLTPRALGRMAARGNRRAHDALLAMTAHGGNGGVLAVTAQRSWQPAMLRDDLLESAIEGLADAGTAAAARRLDDIASARVVPARGGSDLRGAARAARHRLRGGVSSDGALVDAAAFDVGDGGSGSSSVARSIDAQSAAHDTRIDYANHVMVTNPMSDSRVDRVLTKGSRRIGRTDFAGDIACCVEFHRAGTGRWFGSPGDGLDVIDNEAEMHAVLNDAVARMKVVRAINYCGGPGTNIIGCGWMGGKGAAVVRLDAGKAESILWLHEYGHNIGLDHNPTSGQYIMFAVDDGSNRAVTQAECNRYHEPAPGSQSKVVWIDSCTDADADGVVGNVDNCPSLANTGQLDSDRDGVGDVCE